MDWTIWLILLAGIVILVLLYKFGIFRKIFRRGKKEVPPLGLPPLPSTEIRPGIPTEVPAGDVKAKMDLVLAELDSLRVQCETINQRVQTVETMVKELYAMAKS